MTFFVIMFFIYVFFTYETFKMQDALLGLMNYRIARIFAKQGFILKRGKHLNNKEKRYFDMFFMIGDVIKFIPFINVAYTVVFSNIVIKKVTQKKYQESEKRYLTSEEKNSIINAKTKYDLIEAIDLIRLKDIKEEYFDSFLTSHISCGKIYLNGKLPNLAYKLSEIEKMALMLEKPFTIGKIGDDYVAFIGSNFKNPINIHPDNKLFVPMKEIDDSSRFEVYLINLEDLSDEEKNQVVEIIKKERIVEISDSEPNIKGFESTKDRKLELTR